MTFEQQALQRSAERAALVEQAALGDAGALRADRMVSHAFALDDYGDALEMFRSGRGRKLQIRPQADTSVPLV